MGLSAPFCTLVNLLSPDQSGRWLVGTVGIEIASLSNRSCAENGVAPLPYSKLVSDGVKNERYVNSAKVVSSRGYESTGGSGTDAADLGIFLGGNF